MNKPLFHTTASAYQHKTNELVACVDGYGITAHKALVAAYRNLYESPATTASSPANLMFRYKLVAELPSEPLSTAEIAALPDAIKKQFDIELSTVKDCEI